MINSHLCKKSWVDWMALNGSYFSFDAPGHCFLLAGWIVMLKRPLYKQFRVGSTHLMLLKEEEGGQKPALWATISPIGDLWVSHPWSESRFSRQVCLAAKSCKEWKLQPVRRHLLCHPCYFSARLWGAESDGRTRASALERKQLVPALLDLPVPCSYNRIFPLSGRLRRVPRLSSLPSGWCKSERRTAGTQSRDWAPGRTASFSSKRRCGPSSPTFKPDSSSPPPPPPPPQPTRQTTKLLFSPTRTLIETSISGQTTINK